MSLSKSFHDMRSFWGQGGLFSSQLCREQVLHKKIKARIFQEAAQYFHSIYSFHTNTQNYFN